MNIETLQLAKGAHISPEEGACLMEAVSYVAGEKWSDHPACASTVISDFMRVWNDDLNDEDRQMLKYLIPRLVNSVGTAEIETQRKQMISDWYFKVHVPTWLEMSGLTMHAAEAREKGWKADWSAAGEAAWSAGWAAAGEAAWNAAKSAVWSAVWSAARDAARYAALSAGWSAAGSAAGDAARDAAREAARAAAGYSALSAAFYAAWAAARAAARDAARDAARRSAARDAAFYAAWAAARAAARRSAAGSAGWSAGWSAALAASTKNLRPTVVKLQKSALELINACLEAK